jgi:NAD(P)-dependent dehydrogenase (short-subunit alcohol dehydrogenase family)
MKTSLVTGASTGIGYQLARGLARAGHRVLMVSRDPARAAAAAEQVRADAKEPTHVTSLPADLGSIEDTRRVAGEVKRLTDRLDVLVNCAAVVPHERTVTKEGFELAFATNTLAPVVLVSELKGLLAAASPSRIVNFYGGTEKTWEVDDLQFEKGKYDGFKAYGRTKIEVALLTIEMARRLVGQGTTVNASWPGIVNTEGIRAMKGFMGFLMVLMRPLMKTAEQGAANALWLATDPALERVSGKVFGAMKGEGKTELAVPEAARDIEAAKRLYETCERLAKLS